VGEYRCDVYAQKCCYEEDVFVVHDAIIYVSSAKVELFGDKCKGTGVENIKKEPSTV
jgi:hypothetical protein